MTKASFTNRAILLSGLLICCAGSVPAEAGFEWRGPLQAPAPARQAAAPGADDMQGLEPVITWDEEIRWSETGMPAQKVQDVEKVPVPPSSPLSASADTSVHPAPPMASGDDPETVSGFGTDLPLAIALQQVVPLGHQFSFGAGVNPGVSVSWEGGKPWKAVLADMLSPQGLSFRQSGNTIQVGFFTQGSAAPASGAARTIPDDMIGASAAVSAPESVTIRRQKPSSLADVKQASVVETPAPLFPSAPAQTPMLSIAPVALDQSTAGSFPAHMTEPAWSGAEGQTLRDVLKNWSDVAGVELYWSIDYDYRLGKDVGYAGPYDEAVAKLLDGFTTVRPQPYGQLHQGAGGPRVLVIKSYDVTP